MAVARARASDTILSPLAATARPRDAAVTSRVRLYRRMPRLQGFRNAHRQAPLPLPRPTTILALYTVLLHLVPFIVLYRKDTHLTRYCNLARSGSRHDDILATVSMGLDEGAHVRVRAVRRVRHRTCTEHSARLKA